MATRTINAKQLRASLGEVVRRVRKGARYTVIYRSRPAFLIVPVDEVPAPVTPLEEDPLYRAPALGRYEGGHTNEDHDRAIYGL